MTPVELSRTVLRAVRCAVDDGALSVSVPARVVVERSRPGGWGDYATNVALQLARPAGRPPRQVAEVLRPYLAGADGVTGVEITGPGFLNIALDEAASTGLVRRILRYGLRYGHSDALAGQVVQVHCAHEVRAAVVADAAARILRSQGALVRTSCAGPPEPEWESVLGARIDAWGETDTPTPVAVLDTPPPVAGPDAPPRVAVLDTPPPVAGLDVSARFTVPDAPTPLTVLDTPPPVAGPDASARFTGPDTPTPLARPDVPAAFPHPPLRPTPAPTTPLPLGRGAGRWALLHPAPHDRPRISPDHLVQREGNPLFRVRYAHARVRAVVRNAGDLGFEADPGRVPDAAHGGPTSPHPAPAPLEAALAEYPRILAAAARDRGPDRLARHLVTVADAVLVLLPAVLPCGEEKPSAAHRARLALAEAAGTVLAGGLVLLGIEAPDHL
ncbi:ArgS-related anticodon-binding protein NrtL [Streptomyces cadmiisoli]|uniref:ArgS-related anticodon-binding protein NrtL n=1 Tax=Streptomyces cadmiisoli TaxID=2184053 RepID=UPI003656745C